MIDDKFVDRILEAATPQLELIKVAGHEGLYYHGGVEISDQERILPNPRRIRAQKTHHTDVESFIAYMKRFDSPAAVVFADPSKLSFRGILNYHEGAAQGGGLEADLAGWCDHTATFELKATRAFQRWLSVDGMMKPQVEIAEFIEENAEAISDPPAADMLTLARHFDVKRDVKFVSRLTPHSDQISLEYIEEDETKGSVAFPRYIALSLRPYEGTSRAEIRVRFSYSIKGGALRLGFKILDLDTLQEDIFSSAAEQVIEALGADRVFAGRAD